MGRMCRTVALAVSFGCLLAGPSAPFAYGGQGEGFFYAKGPKRIPNGHGSARLPIQSVLPNDVDPRLDYVTLSLRVKHPQTHDLIVKLKRPDFQFGGNPQSTIPRSVTLTDRDTHGRNLGRGTCPDSNPLFAPPGFTTFDDSGGPPLPMMPTAQPPLSTGSAPYAGSFQPFEPLSGFNDYHAAPSTDPASPETWTLIVKDVHKRHRRHHRHHRRHPQKLLCGLLYLHRV
jgi:hypothetical protein